jgi:hypothetical protein
MNPLDSSGINIEIRSTADTRGFTDAERAAQGLDRATGALASGGAKEAGTQLKQLGRAGMEADRALASLRAGGISGLLMGLQALGQMAKLAAGTLGTSFIGLTGAVFAPLAAIILVAKKHGEDMAAANIKGLDDQKAHAERYKQAIEEIDAAAKKMTADMLEGLAEINEKMDETTANMDRAAGRSKAVGGAKNEGVLAEFDLEKEKELAAAKTPEQREAIKQKYAAERADYENASAATSLENEGLNAKVAITNYSKSQAQAREQARAADLQADRAKGEYEDKQTKAGEALRRHSAGVAEFDELRKRGEATPEALEKIQKEAGTMEHVQDLQRQAKEAGVSYDRLQKAADKVKEGASKIIAEAQKKIDDASLTLETLPTRQKTVAMKEATSVQERINAETLRLEVPVPAPKFQGGPGYSTPDEARAELAQLSDQRVHAAFGEGGKIDEQVNRIQGSLDHFTEQMSRVADATAAAHRKAYQTAKDMEREARAAAAMGGGSG